MGKQYLDAPLITDSEPDLSFRTKVRGGFTDYASVISLMQDDLYKQLGIIRTSIIPPSSSFAGTVIVDPASSSRNVIQSTVGGAIELVVKAHASQSVSLQEWQSSAGSAIASISSTGDLTLSRSSAGGTVLQTIANTNTAGSSAARLLLSTAAITAGDPFLTFTVTGGLSWSLGADASLNDGYFVLSNSAALGTTDVLKISNTGLMVFTGDIGADQSASGQDTYIYAKNTNTGASSSASFYLEVDPASTGDPSILFSTTGTTNWRVGIDNNASDAFVLSASTALGTSNVISIATDLSATFLNYVKLTDAFGLRSVGNVNLLNLDSGTMYFGGNAAATNKMNFYVKDTGGSDGLIDFSFESVSDGMFTPLSLETNLATFGYAVTINSFAGTGTRLVTAASLGELGTTTATFPTSAALGDIIYGSATDVWSALAIGAANRLFGVNAAGTGPEYKAVTVTAAGFMSGVTDLNTSGDMNFAGLAGVGTRFVMADATGQLATQTASYQPLDSDLTALAALGLGTANQLWGMNAGATAIEYKTPTLTTAGALAGITTLNLSGTLTGAIANWSGLGTFNGGITLGTLQVFQGGATAAGHAFGATSTSTFLRVIPTSFSPASTGRIVEIAGTINAAVGVNASGLYLGFTIVEAASGNHSVLAGVYLDPPTITSGVATVTDGASLYISAAPTGTVSNANWALLIAAGQAGLAGNVRIGSTTAPTVALDVTGAVLISSTLGVTGAVTLSNLSASQAVFTNGSKVLVSNAITGSGSVMMSVAPTSTGTALFDILKTENAAEGYLTFGNNSSALLNLTAPYLQSTGTGGSAPFNNAGHLIIAPRGSGANRDIYFYTPVSGTQTQTLTLSAGNTSVLGTLGVTGVLTASSATDASAIGTAGTVVVGGLSVAKAFYLGGLINMADAKDMTFGTTTGTKIGTGTTQKIGFWNVTPIVQPSGAAQAAVATTGATNLTPFGYTTAAQADAIVTLVNALRTALVNAGIIKGSA